jgi:thiamine-phosphate pyrophosphorylase
VIGLSTHARPELDASFPEPVDYIATGPVTATPTKPGQRPTGLDYITYAAANATRPFYVTGGVTPESVVGMAAAGARRFVVVRWLTEADDPEEHALALRRAIDVALGE